jgi:PRC-barrel domain
MMLFATLRDYRLQGDVKDMRGSLLYGEGGKKIACIKDFLLDYETGDIRYLVVDCGHRRRVLVPLQQLSYAPDRQAFTADLSSADLLQLPAFTERVLENDDQWRNYEQLYRSVAHEQRLSRRGPVPINRGARSSEWSGFATSVKKNLPQIQRDADQRGQRKRHIA